MALYGGLSRSRGLVGLLGGLVVEVVHMHLEVWRVAVGMAGLGFGVRSWWALELVEVRWWCLVVARVLG